MVTHRLCSAYFPTLRCGAAELRPSVPPGSSGFRTGYSWEWVAQTSYMFTLKVTCIDCIVYVKQTHLESYRETGAPSLYIAPCNIARTIHGLRRPPGPQIHARGAPSSPAFGLAEADSKSVKRHQYQDPNSCRSR